MAHVATESPDDRPLSIVRASDSEKNGTQVAVLCQIVDTVSPMLMLSPDIGKTIEVDPAAKAEALKTFELAHTRLRDIIDAQERWSLYETTAEAAATKLIDAQRHKQEAQVRLLTDMQAPHLLLKAKIRRFPGTGWVAWIGGDVPMTTDLNGVGNTPAQAFAAFDRAHAHLMDLAVESARAAPSPPAPPASPAPKRKPRRK